MKISNLLILICCLLFSIETYAQHNNSNLERYNDGEIDFEFTSELIYNNNNELSEAKVTVTNIGTFPISQDIAFRVHIGTVIPTELPYTYNVEKTLSLSRNSLLIGHSNEVFINLIYRNIGKVITIWPVVGLNKPIDRQDVPYITIIIPPTKNQNKKSSINHISDVNVYPNPTYKNLYIEIPNNHTANQITIYNKAGQPIKTFNGTASDFTVLDLEGLSPDMYFVTIKNEDGQIIHHSKLIFHK